MEYQVGQKCKLLVHGAGVTSEEPAVVTKVTKKTVFDQDREYFKDTGRNVEPGVFGFWFELIPLTPKAKKKK